MYKTLQNRSHLFKKIIYLLIIPFFVASCAGPEVVPQYPATEKILAAVSNIVSDADMVSAIVQIDLVTPGAYYPAKAALLLKKPAYLRLELLPLMGPPDFFLAANLREMKILVPGKGEFYQGQPSGHNLSRFLPWQFDLEDMVAIFAGGYPPLNGEVSYLRFPEAGNMRIEMKARSGISQTIRIGPDGRLNKLERRDKEGNPIYIAEFDDYEESKSIAGKITISMADGTTSITVKYSDLKIEKAGDLSVFDLSIPAGFKKIIMD